MKITTVIALLAAASLPARSADIDGDGLDDTVETNTGFFVSPANTGTNPNIPDTDVDGVPDGLEVSEGTNPTSAADFNSFSTGMVAYYPFNGNANDASGNGIHGTSLGAVLTSDRFGVAQKAYNFNGLSSYLNMGADSAFNLNNVTISVWIYATGNSHPAGIVSKSTSQPGEIGYRIDLEVQSEIAFVWSRMGFSATPGTGYVSFTDSGINNEWSHLVVTKSGGNVVVFKDGLPVKSGSGLTAVYNNASPLLIGAVYDSGVVAFFDGKIDDVRIYDRALSSTEVRGLYYRESPDQDRDGIEDRFETGTGIYLSPTNTGTNPTNPDSDADGLNDGIEITRYGTNPNLADSDSDGFTDPFEINTGFDPISNTSTPDALSRIRTAIEFEFNAAAGVNYRIEASLDLANWATIESGIPGNSGVVKRLYSTQGQPTRYFRARRE